ncbi:hypothetical protein GLAREA_01526 [Glarea lozoyensis ATCC 20868]|uniref:Uncharacterized protein n=1 Tax=Glarea lozoyensis (strain ATCC 20868 / MF5171) TaxID=1116229 RepID=S3CK68_GLAL2|nr:uncharacterized protein GLAREA_01526 [Glarea lozoyensis ATCC 20868]EPE25614.1 hypothetical protein GLAREA_01526 [Glarea lozoyensis ATCC 20868]
MAAQTVHFLGLPFEIRDHIYHYLIPTKTIIDAYEPQFNYTITKKRTSIFEFDEAPAERDTQTSSKHQAADDNLTADKRKSTISESCLSQNTHVPEVMDIGGCTDSEYEVDWDDVTIPLPGGIDRKKNSIFMVCKQISDEALNIMYGKNAFKLYVSSDAGHCLKRNFTEANRCRMRFLFIIAELDHWHANVNTDDPLWTLIPTLNILRLVAKQPNKGEDCFSPGDTTVLEDMRYELEMVWGFRSFREFLICFNQNLPEGKILEVDFDGKSETAEVFKECMPGRYREVRCHLASALVFRRGRFTLKSDQVDTGFDVWES